MHRRKLLSWLPVVAPVLALFILAGCGGSTDEQQVIKKYFDASRMRDQTTLANIATVPFRPQEEGTIQNFNIVSAGEAQRRTLRIKELNAAVALAKQEDDEFTKKKKEYQDANIAAIDRVLRAERENKPLRGKDVDVQKAWIKWREDTAAVSKKLSEARKAANDERSVAELSVYDARNPINLGDYDGDLVTREVTISARVRSPDGQTADKQLVVRVQRAEVKGAAGARTGRWLVTAIK